MDIEIRIAALEQLLKAVVKDSRLNGRDPEAIKKAAQGALMGSHGPSSTEHKSQAYDYLDRLLDKL